MVGVVPFVGDTTGEFGIRKSPILNLSYYFQSVNNEQLFTFLLCIVVFEMFGINIAHQSMITAKLAKGQNLKNYQQSILKDQGTNIYEHFTMLNCFEIN